MDATLWLVGLLSLTLPAEFRLQSQTSERIALPGPPGVYATEEFRTWTAPGGQALHLFLWLPRAPRDLGPMVAAQKWPATVAGRQTTIVETSMFMGRPQHVFVTYLHVDHPEASAMIYATNCDRSQFEALLKGVALTGPPK